MAEWFYERRGHRAGPVPEDALLGLAERGAIGPDTLVWTESFGDEWRPFRRSGLSLAVAGPPPLPASGLNNTFVWLIALVPVFGWLVERMLADTPNLVDVERDFNLILLGYTAVYTALGLIDDAIVRHSGRTTARYNWIALILVPVYLFVRARSVRQFPSYGIVWIIAFVLTLVPMKDYPQALKEILSGEFYLGVGLPQCDSATVTTMVKNIVAENRNYTVIDVRDVREMTGNDKNRRCTALLLTSDAREINIVYSVEDQGDQYYVRIDAVPF